MWVKNRKFSKLNERLTSFVAIVGRGLLLLLLLLFCGVTNASSQPLPPASIKLRLLDGPEVLCPGGYIARANAFFSSISAAWGFISFRPCPKPS